MKTICAWCGSTIQVRCDHCGAPLTPTSVVGASLLFSERDAMTCLNGMTPILYSAQAIEHMEKNHGICKNCAALPPNERDARLARRRQFEFHNGLPSAADLDAIVAEREIAAKHESDTRAADRATIHHAAHNPPTPTQKRGPTGVTRSATVRVPATPKKPHGAT